MTQLTPQQQSDVAFLMKVFGYSRKDAIAEALNPPKTKVPPQWVMDYWRTGGTNKS